MAIGDATAAPKAPWQKVPAYVHEGAAIYLKDV
jgi:hypothetical protein